MDLNLQLRYARYRHTWNKILLAMKLTILLLTAVIMQVSANSFAQKITINKTEVSLKQIIEEIRLQSGYDFLYNNKLLKHAKPVTINVKDASIEEVLEISFANQPITYKLEAKAVWLKEKLQRLQPATLANSVKCEVLDKDGNPLPGVNIKVESTNNGGLTDNKGNFLLKNVKAGDVIIISMLGYVPQRITLNSQTELSITLLEDSQGLNEVVVVGLGTQKKASVIGAISSISTKELKQSPVANISNALAGRLPGLVAIQRSGAPGVNGNDAAQLYIRGIASLNNSSPLIVVDGVEGRTISDIDANDVESVSILKDATATAIYGMRGANGVVLITSRRGSSAKAPSINFTSQFGFQTPTRIPETVNSYEYALLYNQANKNNGTPLTYTQQQLDGYKNHTDPYLYPDNNFADLLLKKKSLMNRQNLTITGGSNFARFFVSAGYLSQQGIYKKFDTPYPSDQVFRRYNFRANVDIDVTKTTLVRLDLSGSFGSLNRPAYPNEPFFSIVRFAPNAFPIKNPNGTWGGYPTVKNNPVAELADVGYVINYAGRQQGTFMLTQKLDVLTKGLSATMSLSYDANYAQDQTRSKSYDAFQYNSNGSYTRINTATKLGAVSGAYGLSRFSTYRANLGYDRSFGDHNVTSTIFYSQQKSFSNVAIASGLQGLQGRTTYNYKNKYFAEATYAYNGSENFAPGKRFGLFPAGAIGWIVSSEDFFKERVKFISFLKLRGSFGIVGNDSYSSRFLYNGYYSDGTGTSFGNPPAGVGGLQETFIGNSDITWEKGYKRNIGIESKWFNNMLSFNVDLFQENRKNILVAPLTPGLAGFPTTAPINKGEVVNKGIEAELGIHENFGGVQVNVLANIGFNRNKVLDNNQAVPKYAYQSGIGQRVGQTFGLIAEGFFQNQQEINNSPVQTFTNRVIPGDLKYKDVNGDGRIDDFDRVPIGYSSVPEIQYGTTLNLSYKNFDISVLFQGSANSSAYFDSFGYTPFFSQGTVLKAFLGSWTPETAASATYPRIDIGSNPNNSRISTFTLQNGNYLRLKNVEIGYSFSQAFLKRIGLQSVRVFANGQNLHTWSKITLTDPEYGSGSIGSTYPQQKVYNFGLSLNF
ncbi:TonB-dependent receptor [Pedobacter sp.]|jgi:TonB-linked SusC/RagA family outer membrane protein|uniref:TonB-dependent receptor n=1 Tax=Pedobacter sp. TaxID=1411316 RepID=UPI002D11ABD1|nr:TonB-dependent receptor [Pedobacter sp.]HWW42500.1 TonB-dependent receptor [Pedobacter sp.]